MKTRCTALIFLSFLLFAFPAHSQSALPAHEWTADQLKAMHGMQTNLALLIAHAALNFQSEKGEQRSITPAKTTYAAKPNPAMMSENEDILSKKLFLKIYPKIRTIYNKKLYYFCQYWQIKAIFKQNI